MLTSCSSSRGRIGISTASKRYLVSNVARPAARPVHVVCQATASTWDFWTEYLQRTRKGAVAPRIDSEVVSQLASEVAAVAKTYKPRFGGGTLSTQAAPVKTAAPKNAAPSTVPTGLQKKLDAIGKKRLQAVTGLDATHAAMAAYTTTELGAAISMTSALVDKDGEKTAVIVFLATEVERGVSWSRLEGLILHWAATDKAGGAWSQPPEGWKTLPNKNSDAGGAWNSAFEKFTLEGGNDQSYALVLQLPLRGVVKQGGIVFVLKAAAGQNTRWLKDSATEQDFFLNVQDLPVLHA